MTTQTDTETRQRHVWAIVYAKGNQRRTQSLWSSKKRAEQHVASLKKAEQEHLELEQLVINGPA